MGNHLHFFPHKIQLSRIYWLIVFTCGFITFISLILIIIKKLHSRGPIQPIPMSNIVKKIFIHPNPSIGQNRETFELQPIESISRHINMSPINVPESSGQERNDPNFVTRNVIISDNTTEESNFVTCKFNNQKFNKSMISIYGLIFLLAVIILIYILSGIAHHDIKNDEHTEILYRLFYSIFCSLPVAMPIIYFISNPKHFVIAVENLPCKCM